MGSTTEEGAALPAAVRSAMTDVGTICSEAAFNVKSTASAYSRLFSPMCVAPSRSCAARTPYGVASAPMPRRFAEIFMHTLSANRGSSDLKSRFTGRRNSLESAEVTPDFSHKADKPQNTAYEERSARQSADEEDAADSSAGRNSCGAAKSKSAAETIKTAANKTFINYCMNGGFAFIRRRGRYRAKNALLFTENGV